MTKVLVVDDDSDICELIAFKLAAMGHEVLVEHDGKSGLATAKRTRPDLVILDCMMPAMTGPEVCRQLRADDDLSQVPIILLTAKAQENDIKKGFAAGSDDYIVKPFSPRELAKRVENLLARVVEK